MQIAKFLMVAAAVSATLSPGASMAQGSTDTEVITALIETLDSASENNSAILSALVTRQGVRRTASGEIVKLPETPLRRLVRIDPPSDDNSESRRAFSARKRSFSNLFSIGDLRWNNGKAIVTVHQSQPLPANRLPYEPEFPPQVGITTFEYSLESVAGRWRVVQNRPIVSVTAFEGR